MLFVADELEDDDDEIDEEGTMYMEHLRKLKKKNEAVATSTGGGGDADSDDDDDEEEIEETVLESYETPLDADSSTVDEYQIFRVLLESKILYSHSYSSISLIKFLKIQ